MNASAALPVYLSAIDEERFGFPVAKASPLTVDSLPAVDEFCKSKAVALLIARCPVTQLSLAQELLRTGFELMDTLVYYSHDLAAVPAQTNRGDFHVRPVRPGEEDCVKKLAADIFRGYQGHYQADRKLDPVKCDQIYESWAYRACVYREVADVVLVAEHGGSVQGFLTVRVNELGEGDAGLFGVRSTARGTGTAQALMCGALDWCRTKSLKRMLISTQIHNLRSQKMWVRSGFEPASAFYTLHKWFERKQNLSAPA